MPVPPEGGWAPGRMPLPPHLSPRPSARGSRQHQGFRDGRRPRRRSRLVRVTAWLSVVASVLVVVLAGGAYAYYRELNGNVHRVPFVPTGQHRAAPTQDGAENILLVGDDSRVGATAAELAQEHTTTDGGASETDTIIILHLAPDDGPATLISIPRDSFVPIQGHGTFKINSAYGDGEADHPGGGVALLTQTVEQLSGLHIDHFVSVGLNQFINISNAIGGVQVCLTHATEDKNSGADFPAGVQTIKGAQALAFVRQRDNLPLGDIDRIKRQERFITAVVQKAKTEKNPATINAVLQTATKSLTVDSGLSGLGLIKLADRLRALDPSQIRFVTIPIANQDAYTPSGVSYVQLDMAKVQQFFANVKAERDPNAPPPDPLAAVTAASAASTHVIVENGSGANGVAAAGREALTQDGFVVDSVGTVAAGSATTIRYNPADAAMAKALRAAVPSATVTADSSVAAGAVVLTLGASSGLIHDPTASSAPTAAPSPSSGTTSAGSLLDASGGVPCGD